MVDGRGTKLGAWSPPGRAPCHTHDVAPLSRRGVGQHSTTGSPYRELVADLMKRGVHIELCGATAKAHKWGNADLLPAVKVNTDAMARTTQLVQERL